MEQHLLFIYPSHLDTQAGIIVLIEVPKIFSPATLVYFPAGSP